MHKDKIIKKTEESGLVSVSIDIGSIAVKTVVKKDGVWAAENSDIYAFETYGLGRIPEPEKATVFGSDGRVFLYGADAISEITKGGEGRNLRDDIYSSDFFLSVSRSIVLTEMRKAGIEPGVEKDITVFLSAPSFLPKESFRKLSETLDVITDHDGVEYSNIEVFVVPQTVGSAYGFLCNKTNAISKTNNSDMIVFDIGESSTKIGYYKVAHSVPEHADADSGQSPGISLVGKNTAIIEDYGIMDIKKESGGKEAAWRGKDAAKSVSKMLNNMLDERLFLLYSKTDTIVVAGNACKLFDKEDIRSIFEAKKSADIYLFDDVFFQAKGNICILDIFGREHIQKRRER